MRIAWRARHEPRRPAVLWRERWLTYADLDAGVNAFAARMRALGVTRGDRVSVLALNHPVHLHALYAAARHGWLHAPLNYRLPPDATAALIEYLDARVLVAGDGFDACVDAARERRPDLTVVRVADLERDAPAGPHAPPAPPDPDATRMLLFTGGTTGTPKAARVTNRGFDANAWDTVSAWGLTPDDATVIATPMFHAGVNALATPILEIGGRIAILETFTAENFLNLNAASGSTIMFAVPTMFQMLVEHPAFATADLSGLRYAIAGGSTCPERVRDAFRARGVRFKTGYGMTEAGVNCFAITLDEAAEKPGSVGRPLPQLEAVIRDANGREVAPGDVGELTLRGPQVTTGYWRRDEDTAACLRHDPDRPGAPFLWTGDLARRDASGCHFIVGRRKEMFISGGENVYPAEIEAAALEHAGVLECAVTGVPDERWGEVGLAGVVARPGHALDASELRAFLKARLAGYQVPKHYRFLESLPKSAAGKVLKRELEREFLEGRPS